jgi:Protein of unknown function (DUF3995)
LAVETQKSGRGLAWTACAVGVLYAAVSVYWGLGGTWLVDTVGGSLAKRGRAGDAAVLAAVWAAAGLKLIAATLPLAAVRARGGRTVWVLSWVAAGILILYGLVLSVVGWLVEAGVVHVAAHADHRALAWHAYLWDPWFLAWGMLIAAALARARAGRVSRR